MGESIISVVDVSKPIVNERGTRSTRGLTVGSFASGNHVDMVGKIEQTKRSLMVTPTLSFLIILDTRYPPRQHSIMSVEGFLQHRSHDYQPCEP